VQSLDLARASGNLRFDLRRFCSQIFRNIDFRGKTMLEIGCGEVTLCLWACLQGAQEVVGIDAHPARAVARDRAFQAATNQRGVPQKKISRCTFQDYTAADRTFDIVVSMASINQLDENSCIRLRESRQAVRTYEGIFRRVARMMKPGGTFIIVDAGRRNFFDDLGLRNPMLPGVEWFKHQQPKDWVPLLQNCGFGLPVVAWITGAWLRRLGIFRLPKALAYFGHSMFRLEMKRIE
jgi:cyclopropane fatty-acyl-phospholipid synthase-like methyltransferase